MEELILAGVLGFLSFSFKNIGYILQKKGVNEILGNDGFKNKSLIFRYLTSKTWILGQLLPFLGSFFLITSYIFAPVSFVMPFMGGGLLMVVLWGTFFLKETLSIREGVAMVFIIIGIFLISSQLKNTGDIYDSMDAFIGKIIEPDALLFLLIPNLLLWAGCLYSALNRWKWAGLIYGIAAGILGGTALIIQKPVSVALKALGGQWLFWIIGLSCVLLVILFSVGAIILVNVGFNHGRGIFVTPIYSIFQMLFPIAGGIFIYDEWLNFTQSEILFQLAGLFLIVFAVGMLSAVNEKLKKTSEYSKKKRPSGIS